MEDQEEDGEYFEDDGEGEQMNGAEFTEYLKNEFIVQDEAEHDGVPTQACDWESFYKVFTNLVDDTPQEDCEEIYRTIVAKQLQEATGQDVTTDDLTEDELAAGFSYVDLCAKLDGHCDANPEMDNQDIFDLICNGGDALEEEGDEGDDAAYAEEEANREATLEAQEAEWERECQAENEAAEAQDAEYADDGDYEAAPAVEETIPEEPEVVIAEGPDDEFEDEQVRAGPGGEEDEYEDGADYSQGECATPQSEEPPEPVLAEEYEDEAAPPSPKAEEAKPALKRQLSNQSRSSLSQIRKGLKDRIALKRAQKAAAEQSLAKEEAPAPERPGVKRQLSANSRSTLGTIRRGLKDRITLKRAQKAAAAAEKRAATPPPQPVTPPPEPDPEPIAVAKTILTPTSPAAVPTPTEEEVAVSNKELAALHQQVLELRSELELSMAANKAQAEDLEKRDKQVEELRIQCQKAEADRKQYKELYEKEQTGRQADNKKRRQEVKELQRAQEELKKLRGELDGFEGDEVIENTKLVTLQTNCDTLQSQNDAFEKEIAHLKAESKSMEYALNDTEESLGAARLQNYMIASGGSVEVQERLTNLESENAKLKDDNDQLESAFNIQFERIRGIQASLTETAEEEGITADDIRQIVEGQVRMLGAQAQPGDLTNTLNQLREEFTGLYEKELQGNEDTIVANLRAAHEGLSDDEDDDVFTKMQATATHQLVLDKIEDELGEAEAFEREGLIDDLIGFTFGPNFVKEDELTEAAKNIENSKNTLEAITNKLSQDTVQNEELLLMNRTLMKEVYASIGDERASREAGADVTNQVGVYKKQFEDAQVELKNAMDVIVQQKTKLDTQHARMEESTKRLKTNAQEEMDRVTGELTKQNKRHVKELTLQLQNAEAKRMQTVQETTLKVEKAEAELASKSKRCEELEMDSQNYAHLKPQFEKLEARFQDLTEANSDNAKALAELRDENKELKGQKNELESQVADLEARQAAVDVAIEDDKTPNHSVDGEGTRICVVGGNDGGLIAANRLKELDFDVVLFHAAESVSPTDEAIEVPEDAIRYKHSVIKIERASQGWLVTYLDSTEEQRVQKQMVFKGIVTGAGMFLPPAKDKVETEDIGIMCKPEVVHGGYQCKPEVVHMGVETTPVKLVHVGTLAKPVVKHTGAQAKPQTAEIGIMPDPPEAPEEPETVLKSELDDLQARYDEVQQRSAETGERLEQLEGELEDVQVERKELLDERADLEKENEELSTEIVDLGAQVTRMKKKLTASGAAVEEADAEAQAHAERVNGQVADLQQDNAALEERVAEAERELQLQQQKLGREQGNLSGDVTRLQEDKAELEQQAQQLAEDKQALAAKLEDAQAAADELSAGQGQLQRDLEASDTQRDQLQQDLDALNTSIAEAGGGADAALQAANKQLQEQCAKLREDADGGRAESGELTDANARLEKLNERLCAKVAQLEAAADRVAAASPSSGSEPSQRRQSLIGEIERASQRREAELRQSQQKIAAVEADNEALQKECDTLRAHLAGESDELSQELLEKNAELTAKVRALEADLAAARRAAVSPPPEELQEATANIDEAYEDAIRAVETAEANKEGAQGASDAEGYERVIGEKDGVIGTLKGQVVDLSQKLKVVSNGLQEASRQAQAFYQQVEPRMALMQEKADTAGRNVTRIEQQVENLKGGRVGTHDVQGEIEESDEEVRGLVDENQKLQRELEAARRKMESIQRSRATGLGKGEQPAVSPASSVSSGGGPTLKKILDFKRDLAPETARNLSSLRKRPQESQQALAELKERFLRLHRECGTPRSEKSRQRGRHS